MAILSLQGLFSGYGHADVVRGIDIALEAGTITCVVGPNGAGKSTVLRTISGLLHPRLGAILLDERQIGGLSPRQVLRAGVVHVPQERSLFPLMTVWENVLLGAHVSGDGRRARKRLAEIAERFPIVHERSDDRAGSLSGGQQKLVEIARALMLDPRLILMDEPSMGLDPKARSQVFSTITDLNRAGHTVLLVEQNARSGLEIADRAVVMDGGAIALDGPARDLLSDPRVAALYLGGRVNPRGVVPGVSQSALAKPGPNAALTRNEAG
jgi:ABC-type branched-subunit amino acid transport system ATPase component